MYFPLFSCIVKQYILNKYLHCNEGILYTGISRFTINTIVKQHILNTYLHCNEGYAILGYLPFHNRCCIVSNALYLKLLFYNPRYPAHRYFPFDNQHCVVKFGSWIYEESQLDLLLKDDVVDLSPPFSENTELDLRSANLTRQVLNSEDRS